MTTSQTNLYHLTIREAAGLLKSGQLSPVELTQAFLDRIEATDDRLHSYIIVLKEQALDDARLAEAEIRRGDYKGPLHGIPFALKDLYDTAGVTTTAGSKVYIDRVPAEDATTTARLKAAGGILLGKLAMHEFALGGPDFTTPFPPARNPWNLDHITGGSSSGSGSAVASGQAMAALGSCTGGSIRGPASLCGIVGLKATYGRVSRAGVVTLSWSQDHCGPMTWTVEDTAYMMQALAGYDPKDPTTSTAPVPDYSLSLREDIKGLTIGVPRHFFFAPHENVNPEVVATVENGLKVLEGLGANLQEVTIPSLEYVRAANSVIMLSEAFAFHEKNLRTRPHDFGEMVRARFRIGGMFSASDYVQSQRVRKLVNREFAAVLQKVDVLVTPTMTQPAAAFEGYDATSTVRGPSFTAPFNLTGLPAISVPCGFTASGLPVGMQIAGKPFDEPGVIRAAYAYQQEARWFEQRPSI
ncbi:MAG: Asp-tRNA(Asn)/Glu-tRNA(Gln) amidotransferase GatCAB subunit A [Chloroflexi bacterium]|nr:Asp-tRNA(Asn)/Glu-tRNA(Gln) amidotransferase GatCAB subunit A [Chloroflexota bacterium]MCH2537205.1 amidase family protein [Dehalococcoidia bacterium]MEE2926949.1 amidase [Chloroflexota bacterium]|tara:strand:+ start:3870 stop:5276 length:1407 start_codon:yes stop_codon:yes gene_type:complete